MSTPDDHETVHHFEDGWSVQVSGPVEEEIGYSGGQVSGSRGFFFDSDMSDAEKIAVIDAQREQDLQLQAASRRFWVRVIRDGVDVAVIDEDQLPAGGQADLLWPPIVSTLGLVMRWECTVSRAEHPDGRAIRKGEAPHHFEVGIQPPWLVEPSGTVRQLPFELAVRPLGAGPDGRLLLPSCHPLWWDGEDESFTWIDQAGATETLLIDGAPVTVSRLCTAIGEPFTNGVEGAEGVFWEPIQGRIVGDELTVRLRGDDDALEPTEDLDPMRLITVAVSLRGPWSVRLIEHGKIIDSLAVPPPL